MFKTLAEKFKKHCLPITLPHIAVSEDDYARYHVNYVWINEDEGAKDGVSCAVPLRYMDIAYENAIKYPQAQFTIWLDHALFDPMTHFMMMSHGYLNAPSNVEFKNLRDIKAYAQCDVYDIEKPKNIWARVDLARLLVLQHQLSDENNKADYQIYSDFDVPDVRLDCDRMFSIMHKHGLFVGETLKYNILENGYLGFDKDQGRDFLESRLLPRAINSAKAGLDGYKPLYKTLHSWMVDQGFWYFRGRVCAPRQEVMGYKVPDNPVYTDNKIN